MDMRAGVQEILGPPSKKGARWWFWPCPFHKDNDPSFGVTAEHGYCFSHHCNWSGDLEWFLRSMKVPEWKQAEYGRHSIAGLSQKPQGIKLPPLAPPEDWRNFFTEKVRFCAKTLWVLQCQHARDELLSRGISLPTIQRFYIGYNLEWIQVPQYETYLAKGIVLPAFIDDRLWSVNVRTGGVPKYHRPKGGAAICPFGIQQLRHKGVLVICEGEMDALTAASALGNDGDAIALRGATQGDLREWIHHFTDYSRIIIAQDGDPAGIESAATLQAAFPTWENRRPPEEANDLGRMYQAGHNIRVFLLHGRKL